jgi:hypothetical protein
MQTGSGKALKDVWCSTQFSPRFAVVAMLRKLPRLSRMFSIKVPGGRFHYLAFRCIGFGTINAAVPGFAVVGAVNNGGKGHALFVPVLGRKHQLAVLHGNAAARAIKK